MKNQKEFASNEDIERRIEEEAIRHAKIVSDPEWEDFHGRELSFRLGAFWMHSLASELKAQQPVDQSLEDKVTELRLTRDSAEIFKAGSAYQAPISRAQGWREAVEAMKKEFIEQFGEWPEKEAKRRGILK